MTNNIDRAAEAEQDETIQTLSRLLAGAEEAFAEKTAQIKRLQAALHKADKWGDILGNLYEDGYLLPDDMEVTGE